jgi:DNA-binding MarR family transcriptional regulator
MGEDGDEALLRAGCDLRVALGRLVRRMRQSHARGELTLAEISVLSRLDRDGPSTPGALADGERVRPQAMGTTLEALESRGLVSRTGDPADGRRAVMSATADGTRLLTDRRQASNQRMAAALGALTPAERAQLLAVVPLLDRLTDAL